MTLSQSHTLFGPPPGTDDPLGLLRACHHRLDARFDTLLRVVEVYRAREEDRYDQAAGALGMVIRHMITAGRLHNEDEEFSLFPRLAEANATARERLLALEAEHETLDEAWDALFPTLEALAEGAEPEPALVARLIERVPAYVEAHRSHLRREEDEVFALAARLLAAEELAVIGEEMAARRQMA